MISHTPVLTHTPLSLNNGWTITQVTNTTHTPPVKDVTVDFPGDIHSALLSAGEISDPYWRDTEHSLDWVHASEWRASKVFHWESSSDAAQTLTLDSVDCHAIVRLNGKIVGECENQFLRYDFDVTGALQSGQNTLEVHFLSNSAVAIEKKEAFPFSVPYIDWNCRQGHYNFLRKTQCHPGWDWNIALSPLGIYGDVNLRTIDTVQLNDVMVRQQHHSDKVTLTITLHYETQHMLSTLATVSVAGNTAQCEVQVYPGQGQTSLSIDIETPKLWWPAGQGEQHLYPLAVAIGNEERDYKIGLREVTLITDKDEVGHRFAIAINSREIFMKGANWIPGDALPARATPEAVRDLLQSAVDANMNMIRIWGGGQYEADWFYDMCSEMGIMIWHDFMFACNLYPAADRDWLNLVRKEAKYQIRRLSSQPCMALWCGDNELVGALGWFDESKNDRDRYLAMYDRLNHALDEAVADEAPDIPFWPSSPSVGPLNFGDGWHDDSSGDMHFWDVWHAAKDFEHYRTVRPRFCSEFGFQSFPSMRVIESFSEPEDRNVSSPVMDIHQRCVGGNSRIVETLARYFRFPDGFEDMAYLSQIGQGLAMKTSIEFWRANKPRCMGTLYWQLNDTWPVASWSSLEYGGGWKLTHYLAQRFFEPVLVTAQPDEDSSDIVLWAVNDEAESVSLTVGLRSVAAGGEMQTLGIHSVVCPPDKSVEITRIIAGQLSDDSFLYFNWSDINGRFSGENEYLPKRPKYYAWQTPDIKVSEKTVEDGGKIVEVCSDVPVLYVSYDQGGDTVYSDNCFTLLPDTPKILTIKRERTSHLPETEARIRYLKG